MKVVSHERGTPVRWCRDLGEVEHLGQPLLTSIGGCRATNPTECKATNPTTLQRVDYLVSSLGEAVVSMWARGVNTSVETRGRCRFARSVLVVIDVFTNTDLGEVEHLGEAVVAVCLHPLHFLPRSPRESL